MADNLVQLILLQTRLLPGVTRVMPLKTEPICAYSDICRYDYMRMHVCMYVCMYVCMCACVFYVQYMYILYILICYVIFKCVYIYMHMWLPRCTIKYDMDDFCISLSIVKNMASRHAKITSQPRKNCIQSDSPWRNKHDFVWGPCHFECPILQHL